MERYSSEEDIYNELVQDSEENWLLGLMAFAVFEEQKIEWIKHFEKNHGKSPNADEIKNWYGNQPQSVLVRAKGIAENTLENFSAEVMETYEDEYRQAVEESIIVAEIRNASRFWPQFGVNIAGGLASAILFAALLILVAFFVLNDASPTKIVEQMKDKSEVIENGKESGNNE